MLLAYWRKLLADLADNARNHFDIVSKYEGREEWALSVNSIPDAGAEDIARRAAKPNKMMRVSTVGAVEALGCVREVRSDWTENGHANIVFHAEPSCDDLLSVESVFSPPLRTQDGRFERRCEVRLWADFNEVDDEMIWTSLRRAPFIPDGEPEIGQRVELYDHEGNVCWGVVVDVDDPIVRLHLDLSTWIDAEANQIPAHFGKAAYDVFQGQEERTKAAVA